MKKKFEFFATLSLLLALFITLKPCIVITESKDNNSGITMLGNDDEINEDNVITRY